MENMTNKENAVLNFRSNYNCTQSLLKAYADVPQEEMEKLMKLSQPFGGGVGRTGGLCGAVSGALMAIGLKYTDLNNPDSKNEIIRLSNEFMDEFKKENGSINCKELLYYDISTEEGRKAIHDKNLRETICEKLVCNSAEILDRIIERNS
jgi:C_GCAxxG_C_C family probable redox protein